MANQVSMFEMLYPTFKFDRPVRLIELFAGYGSQALALKYLNIPFEHWKICEWAVKSIQAYKDIHFTNETFENDLSREELIEYLTNKGISASYNEPMSKEQVSRLKESELNTIYNNIQITHNLVNIQQVKGGYLDITENDKYIYLMTYSFPCQDLSLAGKRKGMADNSTRSGMLWEVERILNECENKPQLLLMENVPQVHSEENMPDFIKWIKALEKMGYTNYWQDLIATDYGIPQTRNRCFMVSILGNYSYSFPEPIPLKLRLKDLLEENVSEKYYLSAKAINGILHTDYESARLSARTEKDGIMPTLCARDYKDPKLVVTQNAIKIKNDTKQGFLEAEDGDGVDISSRIEHHRGTVQKCKAQTILASQIGGVVVSTPNNETSLKRELCNKLIEQGKVKENDVIRHSYSTARMEEWKTRSVEQNNLSPTLDTRCDCFGVVTKEESKPKLVGGIGEKKSNGGTQYYQQDRIYDSENVAICLSTQESFAPNYTSGLRIRKLTPKECFRLMGVKDEDFENVSKNQSNSSLYHLAGDSIVVNVLMAIFSEMI